MACLFPKFPNLYYIIYMDNYFTSIPLFSILCKENISAAGITRPSDTNFLTLLIVLCQNWFTKLDWGTTIVDVVDNILCIGWQDNNFVLGLFTIYTIHEAFNWVTLEYNCSSATSTNAIITGKVFGDLLFILLNILT